MKSAMEQMVEWLKKRRAKVFVWNDNYVERQSVLRKAQELQAEEQAQKPTAPASFMSDIKKWWDTRPLRTSKGEIIPGSPYKNVDEWSMAFSEIYCRYRPAPSSDEGSFKILEPNSVEQAIELYRNNPIFNRLVDLRVQEILSRHPSTAKSDRCGELLERLEAKSKEWYLAGDMRSDTCGELTEILAEFSKDADKEGR